MTEINTLFIDIKNFEATVISNVQFEVVRLWYFRNYVFKSRNVCLFFFNWILFLKSWIFIQDVVNLDGTSWQLFSHGIGIFQTKRSSRRLFQFRGLKLMLIREKNIYGGKVVMIFKKKIDGTTLWLLEKGDREERRWRYSVH